MKVRKAVIPAAGYGTRMLPITKSLPKEMLPVFDPVSRKLKPAIHYVVEEAINSGIDEILIITARGKRAIEDYFDSNPELEYFLKERGKYSELNDIAKSQYNASIYFIRQDKPLGLGHAVYLSRKFVNDEPFVVMCGDDIFYSKKPVTNQLIESFEHYKASIISLESVPKEKVVFYGIIEGQEIGSGIFKISKIVEKPSMEEAPSNLALNGRFVLFPEIFECIEETKPGKSNEIQLTDALSLYIKKFGDVYGKLTEGKRIDIGNLEEWTKWNYHFYIGGKVYNYEKEACQTQTSGSKRPLF